MPSSGEWGKPELKEAFKGDMWQPQLQSELYNLHNQDFTLLLSATCDPYQPVVRKATREILEELVLQPDIVFGALHILILTKSPAVVADFDLLKELDAEVGFTISPWEPDSNAPEPWRRMEALAEAKRKGLQTFLSAEPWYPNHYFRTSIVEACLPYANRLIIGSLNKSGRPVNPEFYRRELPRLKAWLDEQGMVEGQDYFIKQELRRYGFTTLVLWTDELRSKAKRRRCGKIV